MEDVTDESRIIDHQNEVSDKMNGSAGQEIDAPENGGSSFDGKSDLIQSDVAQLKSKLSDCERLSGEVDAAISTIHPSPLSRVESSSCPDDTAMETSPSRSVEPSVEESADNVKELGADVAPTDRDETSEALVSERDVGGDSNSPASNVHLDETSGKAPSEKDANKIASLESNKDDGVELMSVDSKPNPVLNVKEASSDISCSSPVPIVEESSKNLESMDVSSPVSNVPSQDETNTNVDISNEPNSPAESDENEGSKDNKLSQANTQDPDFHVESQVPVVQDVESQSVDLQGTESQDVDSLEAESQDVDLREAESQGADLQAAESQVADLQAKSGDAVLQETESQDVDLQETESQDVDLQETESQDVDLQEADLQAVESQGVDSQEAESQDVDLQESESQGADLLEAESHGAELQEAKSLGASSQKGESDGGSLQKVETSEVKSQDAKVEEARSRDVELQEVESEGVAKSGDIELSDAESQDIELPEVESQGVAPSEAKFQDVEPINLESQDIEARKVESQDTTSHESESQGAKLQEDLPQDAEMEEAESRDAEVQDSNLQGSESQDVELQEADINDASSNKSVQDHLEERSVENIDLDDQSDSSMHVDENSSEPAEKTRFLSVDQDAVHDDVDTEGKEAHENVEDPFSAEKAEKTEKTRFLSVDQDTVHDDADTEGKEAHENVEDPFSAEKAEKTSFLSVDQDTVHDDADTEGKEAQENVEDPFSAEPEESSEAKQTEEPEDSAEGKAESVDPIADKEVTEITEDSSEEKETTEMPEDSSEEKGTTEMPEDSSEGKESTEMPEDSLEGKETTEESEESKEEIVESIEASKAAGEPEESIELAETSGTSAESLGLKETVEDSEKSLEAGATVDEAEESSEARETSGEGEALNAEASEDSSKSKEILKEGEDVPKTAEDIPKTAEDVLKTAEDAPKTADETAAAGDSAASVEDGNTELKKDVALDDEPEGKTTDESAPKSPKDSTAAETSVDSSASADQPELMEVDESAEKPENAEADKDQEPETKKRWIHPNFLKKKRGGFQKKGFQKGVGCPRPKKAASTEDDEIVIVDDDVPLSVKVENLKKQEQQKAELKKPGRPKKNAGAKGADAENICIIPDLPEIESVSSLAAPQKAGRSAPAPPPTPSGRTQRRAAKTAGLKLRRMMAAEVEPMPGKDAVQPVEKSVSSANFVRKCAECRKRLIVTDLTLYWETMEYCDSVCLGAYLSKLGKFCANCRGDVQSSSLGKYCVRFGTDINQFCCSQCLEEFKKGLKVCSYCQKDISSGPEGFLAPVGDKGQFKDFCSQECMVLYETISNNAAEPIETQKCTVCSNENVVQVRVRYNNKITKLCSDVCFAAFKFANSIECEKCNMCRKYYHDGSNYVIFYEEELHTFCSKTCMNVYILGKRRIILCSTCKVKKYNFDMIKRVLNNGSVVMACSLNCLTSYQSQKNISNATAARCDSCKASRTPQYYLNMSDNSFRSLCSNLCVSNFQSKHRNADIHPVGNAKRASGFKKPESNMPVISTVTSLAQANGPSANSHPPEGRTTRKQGVVQHILVRPPPPKSVSNKIIQCRPAHNTKGVSCKPFMTTKSTQTEKEEPKQVMIPIPVPIFVPLPCAMYKLPVPFAMPIPLPIPVPIFIPTTRNSAKGIMKEMKKIQKKIPQDPYEAELLMMAAMVAEEKKPDETSSSDDDDDDCADVAPAVEPSLHDDSEEEEEPAATVTTGNHSPAASIKSSAPLHLDDLPDIEDTLKPATIVPTERPPSEQSRDVDPPSPPVARKARKRTSNSGLSAENLGVKRVRRSQDHQDTSPNAPSPPLEIIRPDANMNLKYTYGVNAWRQWVLMKNIELEKAASKNNRKPILFKTDLMKLTPDELNYALCLFLKEVKKPSGGEYAPDTLFYFCLGIQHYLFENGRVDNLFTDPFYETFTDRLDEVGIKFSSMYDGTRQIVTRIEEEHLWESKQLGAHSPHVLLNTLMFFNTKHFNLATVDEHMQLSFAHIMKHWKRNSGGAAAPVSSKTPQANRNVLLRFYPPQSALEGNSRKKKMYEQKENEQNPLRCPVKLYEFYLSKCPESVKTRNDVFYLLPERSCVPDSPVWYSTMAYDKKSLNKMLNRIKMVKEVNIALLTL